MLETARNLHLFTKINFCQFSDSSMVLNRDLPHTSGKIMVERIVLSIFSISMVKVEKKENNYNEKYEILLHTPHFNARRIRCT